MFNSLRSRILIIVVSIVVLTVCTTIFFVQREATRTLSDFNDEAAVNILNAVTLNVENEYRSILFHKKNTLEIRKSERKNIVKIAISTIDEIYKRYKKGLISEKQAKLEAVNVIKNMRYDKGVGYLWINDTRRPTPRMIMHPTLPELNGKILDDPRFNCALGIKKNLFTASVDICLSKGDGYVDYLWPKPLKTGLTEDQPKISYVALYKKWSWIIGTGVYIEDIEEDSKKRVAAVISELKDTFAGVYTKTNGYMYIFDKNMKILIHPVLSGVDGSRLKNPVTGNLLGDELMRASKTPEKAFEYIWDKPPLHKGEFRFKKRVFVRHFKPLDWYIVNSVYVDEISTKSSVLTSKFFYISLVFLFFSITLSVLLSKTLSDPLRKLMFSAEKIENEGLSSAKIPVTGTIETKALGKILDKLFDSINISIIEKEQLLNEVQKAHDELEKRVKERTRDLEEANTELKEAKINAESANKAKSDFLANMSHEIRTPMNSVLGFTEILKEKTSDKESLYYLDSIHTSGKSLLTLINDILDLSKVEAGKIEIEYYPLSIKDLVNNLEILFKQKTDEKNIEFSCVIPDDLPKVVLFDEVRLRQILVNLISNAVKFTEDGNIGLVVDYEFKDESFSSSINLFLTVSDTGIGMEEEEIDIIFDPFEQLKSQGKNKYGGTGLGLAITKRLIDIMNGEISVKTSRGTGSSFQIIFRDIEVAFMNSLDQRFSGVIDPESVTFKKSTVLVADDITFNRELLIKFLEKYDIKIKEAKDGKEAVDIVKNFPPDLILLDMKMPVMDGYEAAEILKSDEKYSNIPIVVITASAMKHDEEKIRGLCDGYLKKPVSKKDLIQEIMNFLPCEVKKTVNELEEKHNIADLSNLKEECSSKGILEIIETYGKRLDELVSLMAIDKIEEIALEIKEIGDKEECGSLKNWAEELYIAATQFETDRIKKLLKGFSEVS